MIGRINFDTKIIGKRSAGKPQAAIDEAGAGDVNMRAGLRAGTKVTELPPDSKFGAPVLDPTHQKKCVGLGGHYRPRDLSITKLLSPDNFLPLYLLVQA